MAIDRGQYDANRIRAVLRDKDDRAARLDTPCSPVVDCSAMGV